MERLDEAAAELRKAITPDEVTRATQEYVDAYKAYQKSMEREARGR